VLTVIFCDTSTLAKFYVTESESVAVRTRLDREERVLASELAKVELMAVFHRRLRERSWTRTEFLAVVRQFTKDDVAGYWGWIPLETALMNQVARVYDTLPETVHLRTADCIHLITALQAGLTEIHTHDHHQIQAAAGLGLSVVTIR